MFEVEKRRFKKSNVRLIHSRSLHVQQMRSLHMWYAVDELYKDPDANLKAKLKAKAKQESLNS